MWYKRILRKNWIKTHFECRTWSIKTRNNRLKLCVIQSTLLLQLALYREPAENKLRFKITCVLQVSTFSSIRRLKPCVKKRFFMLCRKNILKSIACARLEPLPSDRPIHHEISSWYNRNNYTVRECTHSVAFCNKIATIG